MIRSLYNRQEGKESNKWHQAFQPQKWLASPSFLLRPLWYRLPNLQNYQINLYKKNLATSAKIKYQRKDLKEDLIFMHCYDF